MDEEDKYYIVYKNGFFKGFLIADNIEIVRKEITCLGENYTATGRYITKKSKTGND